MKTPGLLGMSQAAQRSLQQMSVVDDAAEAAEVRQLVLNVEMGSRRELVSLAMRDGSLACSSTDGDSRGPFAQAALHWLAGAAGVESPRNLAAAKAAQNAAPLILDQPSTQAMIAAALDDIVTAVVRNGVDISPANAPALEDSLQRLIALHSTPAPLGLGRWVGRLRLAIATANHVDLARLLCGASLVAADLRERQPTDDGRGRLAEWFGSADLGSQAVRLQDRQLVEVAREWLPGLERAAIERRYLVDLDDGEIYREERLRSGVGISVGPCPRFLSVGLAIVEPGLQPRRIRVLQYAVSLDISEEQWKQLGQASRQDFGALAESYRSALRKFPGLSEPFVWIAPRSLLREPTLVAVDGQARSIAIAYAEDPGAANALEVATAEGETRWISGRLTDSSNDLLLIPCSAALLRQGQTVLWRAR